MKKMRANCCKNEILNRK